MYWILGEDNFVEEECRTLREAKALFEAYYDRNGYYRIEKAKKFYEVALMEHVEGSVEDDFVTVQFEEGDLSYYDCVRIAKEQSLKWDACNIICYTWNTDTMYCEIFRERYIKGKKQWRTYMEL